MVLQPTCYVSVIWNRAEKTPRCHSAEVKQGLHQQRRTDIDLHLFLQHGIPDRITVHWVDLQSTRGARPDSSPLPRLELNRELWTVRSEVILEVRLVLPRVPPFSQPEPKALHQRADDGLYLLHREPLPRAVHRPMRERDEGCLVMHKLKVCRHTESTGG